MNGDFKPLRRKIGVVTLVMACVLAAGWVRCYSKHDILILSYGNDSSIQFLSVCRCLVFVRTHSNGTGRATSVTWETTRWYDSYFLKLSSQVTLAVKCKRFQIAKYETHDPKHDAFATCFAIPYWSIVIPLTLLSAWLLLSKPRATKLPESAPESRTTSSLNCDQPSVNHE